MLRNNNFSLFFTVITVFLAFFCGSVSAQNYYYAGPNAQQYRGYGAGDYTAQSVQRTERASLGRVIQVSDSAIYVDANTQQVNLGSVVGGLIAGAVAYKAHNYATTAAAAGVGALIGGQVGEHASRDQRHAVSITVREDAGGIVVVTQEPGQTFMPGDRVLLVQGSGGVSRVLRAPQDITLQ